MKKKMLSRLLALVVAASMTISAVPVYADHVTGVSSDDTIMTVSSNNFEPEKEVAALPVMPEISKEDFNAQMRQMVDAVNAANGITEDDLCADMAATYPSSYDPRKTGKVSAVSNQGNWGICWVYSAIAMTEQNLVKQGFETNSVDLSELHAVYFDYISRGYTCSFTTFCSTGGTEAYILGDMVNGIGPVYESTVPMQTITDELTLDSSLMYQHLYEPHKSEGATLGTDAANINEVKRLITQYGAVLAGMYLYTSTDYLGYAYNTGDDMTYYLPYYVTYENHAITIVGWDDNYAASNFQQTPPGNGAWLVKQSYGTNNERSGMGSGYMWISYYDRSIDEVEVGAWEFAKNGQTPKTITLSSSALSLTRGKTAQLTAAVAPTSAVNKNITWKSSDESVATVTQSGLVSAVGKGNCNIIVESVDGYAEASCEVTVSVLTGSIEAADITLVKGQTVKPEVSVKPYEANNRDYTLTSSDSAIVSVDQKKISALKEGTVKLTIETLDGSGVKKEITVTVLSDAVLDIQPDGFGETITIEDENEYPSGIVLSFKVTTNSRDSLNAISAYISNENTFYMSGQGCVYTPDSDGKYGYQVSLGFQDWRENGETELVVESADVLKKKYVVKLVFQKVSQSETENTNTGSETVPDQDNPKPDTPPVTPPVTDPCESGHDYQTVTKKASTTADGYTQKQCTRCGNVKDKKVIAKASEIYLSDDRFTYTGKAIDPEVSVFDANDRDITEKCSIRLSSNKKVGKATVRISCNTSEYRFTTYRYFTIVPKTTSVKKADKNGKNMTVTWKKQSSQTDGYEIQYSTKKSFTKSATKTVKVKGNKTTKKTIKKLSAKKKYYVRIRTYKKVGSKTYYSSWSKKVTAK